MISRIYWRWHFTEERIEAWMGHPRVPVRIYFKWRTVATQINRLILWTGSDCYDCRRPTVRFGRSVGNHARCYDPPF
jgi:hypothetical protein